MFLLDLDKFKVSSITGNVDTISTWLMDLSGIETNFVVFHSDTIPLPILYEEYEMVEYPLGDEMTLPPSTIRVSIDNGSLLIEREEGSTWNPIFRHYLKSGMRMPPIIYEIEGNPGYAARFPLFVTQAKYADEGKFLIWYFNFDGRSPSQNKIHTVQTNNPLLASETEYPLKSDIVTYLGYAFGNNSLGGGSYVIR